MGSWHLVENQKVNKGCICMWPGRNMETRKGRCLPLSSHLSVVLSCPLLLSFLLSVIQGLFTEHLPVLGVLLVSVLPRLPEAPYSGHLLTSSICPLLWEYVLRFSVLPTLVWGPQVLSSMIMFVVVILFSLLWKDWCFASPLQPASLSTFLWAGKLNPGKW